MTNGLTQECVLGPTLSSTMFTAMLTDAFHNRNEGIVIRYRKDGNILNRCRLHAVSKVKETVLKDFLFADKCALRHKNQMTHYQERVSILPTPSFIKRPKSCTNLVLADPTGKSNITMNNAVLNDEDKFIYLDSTQSLQANINEEVNCRISKASNAVGALRQYVWDRRGIHLTTRIWVYQTVVITTLLYACKT